MLWNWSPLQNIVQSILAPLDSGFTYKQRSDSFQPSQEILLDAFRHSVIDDVEIRSKILHSVTAIVEQER